MTKIPEFNFKLTNKEEDDWFNLIVFGDEHVGHKKCQEDKIAEMVAYIAQKNPNNTAVVLTGDHTENVLPGTKGSMFELSIPDPEEQEDRVVELLDPIKHMIVAGYNGNHSHRSEIAAGHCPDKNIMVKLGIGKRYLGYSGYFKINLKTSKHTQSYIVWGEHGSRNAKTLEGKVRVLRQMGEHHQDADVYVMGHIHTKLAIPDRVIRVVGGCERVVKVMYASNGTYLFDPAYGRRGGYIHGGPGVAKVQLCSRRRDVHCSV